MKYYSFETFPQQHKTVSQQHKQYHNNGKRRHTSITRCHNNVKRFTTVENSAITQVRNLANYY